MERIIGTWARSQTSSTASSLTLLTFTQTGTYTLHYEAHTWAPTWTAKVQTIRLSRQGARKTRSYSSSRLGPAPTTADRQIEGGGGEKKVVMDAAGTFVLGESTNCFNAGRGAHLSKLKNYVITMTGEEQRTTTAIGGGTGGLPGEVKTDKHALSIDIAQLERDYNHFSAAARSKPRSPAAGGQAGGSLAAFGAASIDPARTSGFRVARGEGPYTAAASPSFLKPPAPAPGIGPAAYATPSKPSGGGPPRTYEDFAAAFPSLSPRRPRRSLFRRRQQMRMVAKGMLSPTPPPPRNLGGGGDGGGGRGTGGPRPNWCVAPARYRPPQWQPPQHLEKARDKVRESRRPKPFAALAHLTVSPVKMPTRHTKADNDRPARRPAVERFAESFEHVVGTASPPRSLSPVGTAFGEESIPEMQQWRGDGSSSVGVGVRARGFARASLDDDPWGVESDTDGSLLAMRQYAADPDVAIEVSLAGCRPGRDHWTREYARAHPVQPPHWKRPNLLPVLHARGQQIHIPDNVRGGRASPVSPPPAASKVVSSYTTKSGAVQQYGSHHAPAGVGATAGWHGLVGLPVMS